MVPPNCTCVFGLIPCSALNYTGLIDGRVYASRRFELFDAQLIPYPDEHFDIVHARNVHTGVRDFLMPKLYHTQTHTALSLSQVRNYPLFLEEIARVLRPGGLVILAEPEIKPMTEGKEMIQAGPRGGAPGWREWRAPTTWLRFYLILMFPHTPALRRFLLGAVPSLPVRQRH